MRSSGSGKIIGGAVIDGGADNRQAQGHVNSVIEVYHFNGNESLVMIHGNHRIEFPFASASENRVRRMRPTHFVRTFLETPDHGFNKLQFFASEATLLTRMRIETGNPDAGAVEGKIPFECLDGDGNGAINQFLSQHSLDVGERMMDRGQGYAQPRSGKHHHHVVGVGETLEEFGMARERKSVLLQVCLVNRAGANRLNLTRKGQISSLFDIVDRCPASGLRWPAVGDVFLNEVKRIDDTDRSGLACAIQIGHITEQTKVYIRSQQSDGTPQSRHLADHHRCTKGEDLGR
jgi:hypothetical protein